MLRGTRLLRLVVAGAALLLSQALPSPVLAQEGQLPALIREPAVPELVPDRPPPIIVRELAVEGNRRIAQAIILGRVQTRVGSPLLTAQVAADVRAIFALGFFDDVRVKVGEFEDGIRLAFVVVERPFIREIEFMLFWREKAHLCYEDVIRRRTVVYQGSYYLLHPYYLPSQRSYYRVPLVGRAACDQYVEDMQIRELQETLKQGEPMPTLDVIELETLYRKSP